jgi:hypothetical protein
VFRSKTYQLLGYVENGNLDEWVRSKHKEKSILTVVNWPPDRWPATALEIEGFSATQSILPGIVLLAISS